MKGFGSSIRSGPLPSKPRRGHERFLGIAGAGALPGGGAGRLEQDTTLLALPQHLPAGGRPPCATPPGNASRWNGANWKLMERRPWKRWPGLAPDLAARTPHPLTLALRRRPFNIGSCISPV